MGAPKGNDYGSRHHFVSSILRRECLSDNGARLRAGMRHIVDRFQADGNLADGQFIRDTLDGKPKQQVALDAEGAGQLQSLQVMFVQAIAQAGQESILNQALDHTRPALEGQAERLQSDTGGGEELKR